jgi:cytosine/adenosine deaminase-related metal-dependent hydrolase
LSMDPRVGDFAEAAVLIEGKKIVAVDPKLEARGAAVIDAGGKIVMPGFGDTHHHQFETALRGFLADGLLATTAGCTARSTTSITFWASLPGCTGPRTCTSTSCSAR